MNDSNPTSSHMTGWLRKDGRKGIRNNIVIVYLVECAHHVAREISIQNRQTDIHVIGFSGCFPNTYAENMMEKLCTHPNVGGALLVSLGCENFKKHPLLEKIEQSGRPAKLITIQENGGTRESIQAGLDWIAETRQTLDALPKVPMHEDELIIGTICGGSDATSGMTGNPAAGVAFDMLIEKGATCIFEETGELIGCEQVMADRAINEKVATALTQSVQKAIRYYGKMGYGSFSHGNAKGGLSTIEEKSLGAYAKSGSSKISGIVKPGETPPTKGLYLLDVVPEGDPTFGFPNINDTAEIIELISCGAHAVIFVTGRGSIVGSAISPVLKVCANPETYERLSDDMDVNAGRILSTNTQLNDVGSEIYEKLINLGAGQKTVSEELMHQEFVLTYKEAQALGPSCHPG